MVNPRLQTLSISPSPRAFELLSASPVAGPLRVCVAALASPDLRQVARGVHTIRALADAARLEELGALAEGAERALESGVDTVQAMARLAQHAGALLQPEEDAVDAPALWQRSASLFEEAARAHATTLGKVAELRVYTSAVIYGRDLTLLTSVVLHLVRNAIAHGIEPSSARVTAFKPPVGRLDLTLDLVNGVLFGRFADDGAGIDLARVGDKARELGLWRNPENPSALDDVLGLLTAPGFTTRRTAEAFFGRGVGLEAVRAALADHGGDLRLERTGARGTALTFSWVQREAPQFFVEADASAA